MNKITLIALIFVSLSLFSINSVNSLELQMIDMDSNSITYRNTTSDANVTDIYSKPVNMLNIYDEFESYHNVTNFTISDYNISVDWNGKQVVFKFYEIKNNITTYFDQMTQQRLNEINLTTSYYSSAGSYIYNHTMTENITLQPDVFGYEVITTNVNCFEYDTYYLACGNQSFSFAQAVFEQNLTVEVTNSSVEFSGEDLSWIDPEVEILSSTSIYGHVRFDYEEYYDDGDAFLDEESLDRLGSDDNSQGYIRRGWVGFDLDSIDDNVEITNVQLRIDIRDLTDNECPDNTLTFRFYKIREDQYDLNPGLSNNEEEEVFYAIGDDTYYGSFNIQSEGVLPINLNSAARAEAQLAIDGNPNYYVIAIKAENSDEVEDLDCRADIDDAGSDRPILRITYVPVDIEEPDTSASATSPPGGPSYSFGSTATDDVEITLSCVDNGGDANPSGCDYTNYCVDLTNECSPNLLYSSPFNIEDSGNWYVRFRSTDNNGNIESIESESVIVDLGPPGNYPSDVNVSVGNTLITTLSSTFYQEIKITGIENEINDYLDSCTPDPDGFCNVPIEVASESVGQIDLFGISIFQNISSYMWNTSNLTDLETYRTRMRSYDGYLYSEWDETESDFTIGNPLAENLDVSNFSIDYQNNEEVIFSFTVTNTGNSTYNNVLWVLNSSETTIISQNGAVLSPSETLEAFVFYNYTTTGNFTANVGVVAYPEYYTDTASIDLEVTS